jgi:hypothetical protein
LFGSAATEDERLVGKKKKKKSVGGVCGLVREFGRGWSMDWVAEIGVRKGEKSSDSC